LEDIDGKKTEDAVSRREVDQGVSKMAEEQGHALILIVLTALQVRVLSI